MLKVFLKKWLLLSGLILFTFLIGLKTYLDIFFYLFYFLLTLLILSLLYLALQYFSARLYLKRIHPEKVNEDDSIDLEVKLKNEGFLPILNMVLEDNLTCAEEGLRRKNRLIEFIKPRSSITLRYNCLCYLRGYYSIGPFSAYFFDPFGLLFFKKTYPVLSHLYVYPKTFKVRRFPSLVKGNLPWFGIGSSRSFGDEEEFFGTREYKSGDSIKRIHWLSTARKHTLIVKQFQRQSYFSATILFNLEKEKNFGEGKEAVAEYIIKIAASLSKYFLAKGISVEIIAQGQELMHIPDNKGAEHLENILKALATAKAESKIDIGELFGNFSHQISDNSNLIVIMLDRDWEYLQSMIPMEKRNISLIPLILVSSTFLYSFEKQEVEKDVKLKLSEAYNFAPILISRGDNLEEVFLKI